MTSLTQLENREMKDSRAEDWLKDTFITPHNCWLTVEPEGSRKENPTTAIGNSRT